MNKRVLLSCILLIFLINIISFVVAADNETNVTIENTTDEQSQVDKAYECLENKIDGKCSSLSSEERIFVLLALQDCESEVKSDSLNDECWPKSGCKLKSTAQAILALDRAGSSTSDAEEWLLSQNGTPSELTWYLEIESPDETTCSIKYSGGSYSVTIGEDKVISNGAGSCLTLSSGGYWLKVSPSCYDYEFEVSCDNQFLTTLLFKKVTSSTIHVSEKVTSASAEGTTTEKVNSVCFKQGTTCNYEGSLWAALVLDSLNYDVSPYMPYLITMAEGNEEYIPESFLYFLTGYPDFRNDLLLKQKSNYWDESGDKFYDTALALYPFKYEDAAEKTESINWLLEVQDDEGCWQGNIRNTAFILYSIWTKDFSSGGETNLDCESSGYYCLSGVDCATSDTLDSYSCSGLFKCCAVPKTLDSCYEQGGDICDSDYECTGGTTVDASDLEYGQTCCVGGQCMEPGEETVECELNGGICKSIECGEGEKEAIYSCYSGQICCVAGEASNDKSYWWIWILLLLIALVILAIIFRDKLRIYLMRFKKSGKDKPKPGSRPPLMPSRKLFGRRPMRRPTSARPSMRRGAAPKSSTTKKKPSNDLDDVLKKLKDMGK